MVPDEYGNIYCYPGQNVPSAMCPNPYKTWRWVRFVFLGW